MKIRYKIIVPLAIGAILVAAGATGGIIWFGQETLRDNIQTRSRHLAEAVVDEINVLMGDRIERIETYAIDLAREEALLESNERFAQMEDREAYIETREERWRTATDTSALARRITENKLSQEVRNEFQLRDFYTEKYGHQVFSEVLITNRYGVNVAQTNVTTDFDQVDEAWWQKAKENGVFVNEVERDRSADAKSVEIAVRIENADGEFLGVLNVVYNLKEIFSIIERLAERGHHSGNRISSAESYHLLTQDGDTIFATVPHTFLERSKLLQDGAEGDTQDSIMDAAEFWRVTESGHVLVSAQSKAFRQYPALGWRFVVKHDSTALFSSLSRIRDIVLVLAGVGVVVLIGVSLIVARFITRPLSRLQENVREIMDENFDTRIRVRSNDEVGDLAASFEQMRRKLQESFQQLTEQEQEQREEKERVNTILNSIGDGVFVLDDEKCITRFNGAAEEISGFQEADVLGSCYDEVLTFTDEQSGELSYEFIDKVYEEGETQKMRNHTMLTTKNGEQVPVADSAAPITDENGNVVGCVVVFRDVTEEYRLEKSKNTFLSIASHQLRTPLGSMRWNIESLLDGDLGKLPKKACTVLEQMKQSNERLVSLVNDLLNISRMEQGRLENDPQELDLNSLINEIGDSVRATAQQKGVELQLLLDDDIPKVYLDKQQMENVLENLMSNAVKYCDEGDKMTVETRFTGNSVKVSVSDTGIGIPKDQQDKIFSRFFRASNAEQRNVQGTGIGLNVAKMFVENMGGKIWFESAEGAGTVFHVVFPYDTIKEKPAEHQDDQDAED